MATAEPITISAPDPATADEWGLWIWQHDPNADPNEWIELPIVGWVRTDEVHIGSAPEPKRPRSRRTEPGITLTELPAICTTDEAMRVLRMSRRNLYRLVARGALRAKRPTLRGSSRLLIPRAEIERYLSQIDR